MPFVYNFSSAGTAFGSDCQTNATPNTEQDDAFLGTGGMNAETIRRVVLQAVYCSGKSAGLTVISGIAYRLKKWTTTSSTGGAGLVTTTTGRDPGSSFGGAPIGHGFRVVGGGAITSGTGGPTYIGGFVSGATGPGGWIGPNANSWVRLDDSGGAGSLDVFSASATASLKYEMVLEATIT